MTTTSVVTTIMVAGLISIGTAVSAFAQCENFIGTASRGTGNTSTIETWGHQYASVDQDGDRNHVRGRIQGLCNGLAIGQYGDRNRAKANIVGRNNAVGMLQNSDDVRARTNVIGDDNGVFLSQSRNGSRASIDIDGKGNRSVIIQH